MRNELITFTDPKSPVSEMFRTLRTNLQFMGNSKKIQTVLITSTLPGEGKSWTTANLAVTFAQAGKKVVIVDADLRKGRQFSIFNVVSRPGLSNYLSGVVNEGEVYNVDDIRSFIRETNIEGLYVIPAGDIPPNPAELLVNSRMNQLLINLKLQYDIIIFDAPPALLVADATILARMVDTSMIVVAHQETKMDNLNKVQKSIKNVGGNIAGVVINKIPMSVKKYQYSYYGGYESPSKPKKDINPDLYLRGKATILDDRNKSKEIEKNINNNKSLNSQTNIENDETLNHQTNANNYESLNRQININNDENLNSQTNVNNYESFNSPINTVQPSGFTGNDNAHNLETLEQPALKNETEELLKRMNDYVEEQKKKMNNL